MLTKSLYNQLSYLPIASLLCSILLGVGGQLCLKVGAMHLNTFSFSALASNAYLWCGATVYFLSLILYILSLRDIPLNIAFPSVSLSYILVITLSHYFLNESISMGQMAGSLAIVSGVLLLWLT